MPILPQSTRVGQQINDLRPAGRRSIARVLEIDSAGQVVIELDQQRVPGVMVMIGYYPKPDDWVLVERLPQVTLIVGAYSPTVRSPSGTVTNTNPGDPNTIEVTDPYGVARLMPYLSSYTPANGDLVSVQWSNSVGLVLGKRGTTAAPPPAYYQPPIATPPSNPFTVRAVDTATWRGGSWYTNEVIQGDFGGYGQNFGAWFYGGTVRQSLYGLTITGAEIYLPRIRGGFNYGPGEPVHLYQHSSDWRPGGDVSRVAGPYDAGPVPLGGGWYPISLTLAQSLTAGGGVGVASDPYVKLASLADPSSGSISFTWKL